MLQRLKPGKKMDGRLNGELALVSLLAYGGCILIRQCSASGVAFANIVRFMFAGTLPDQRVGGVARAYVHRCT